MDKETNAVVRKDLESDEYEIDLIELFNLFLRNWLAVLLSVLMVGSIFGAYTKFMIEPVYESTAKIYVLPSNANTLLSLADLQIGNSLQDDYVDIIQGRPILDQAIRNLKLDMNYKQLKKKITVSTSSDRIICITAKDTDPTAAKKIVDEITDLSVNFIADYMDQSPPSVLQYGYDDEEKVSPSMVKNTAIGAIIGFVIVAAILIVSHFANNTIDAPEDIEKKLDVVLLGTIPLDKSPKAEKVGSRSRGKRKVA